MERVYIVGIVIAAIIILGFISAALSAYESVCTKMGCPCAGVEGERPCNSCSILEPIFTLGIVNLVKVCPGSEIITCENGIEVDKRIDWKDCEYRWYILGMV